MKIFVMCGTHSNELFLAPVVATFMKRLVQRYGSHSVVYVGFPESRIKRRAMGVVDGWKSGHDISAESAYDYLLLRGFGPENPEHIVLDVHENPVNWREVFPQHTSFYRQNVEPSIQASIKRGGFGAYYAVVPGKEAYSDIFALERHPFHELRPASQQLRSVFYRLEIPIIGRKRAFDGEVVADVRKTRGHYSEVLPDWKRRVGRKLAKETVSRLRLAP